MPRPSLRSILIGLVLVCVTGLASADPAPSLSLTADGHTAIVQDAREPLLLTLTVQNASPDEPLAMAGPGRVLREFITFRVLNEAGKPVLMTIRPLATSSNPPGLVRLNPQDTTRLLYGIDPQLFMITPDGRYTIQAVFSTRGGPGVWEGEAVSPPVSVTFTRAVRALSVQDANGLDAQRARFYLLDQQFAKVEQYVQAMLNRDAKSVDAWMLRGDALAGQGKRTEARAAFEHAMTLWQDAHRFNPFKPNPPAQLVQRLNDAKSQ